MPKSRKETNLSQENQAARELGSTVAREFERVVETFNRVLQYKERIGQGLEDEIIRVGQQAKSNREELDTLTQEIESNKENLSGIVNKLDEIQLKEKRIVEQYQRMLKGAEREVANASELESAKDSDEAANLREQLIRQKENFLERMQNTFKQLDEDLLSTTTLKDDLEKSKAEISQRNQEAGERKEVLEATSHRLFNNLESYAKELETSIEEERILVDEFTRMVKNVENCVTLSEEIDRVLFSSLDAAEGPSTLSQAGNTGVHSN